MNEERQTFKMTKTKDANFREYANFAVINNTRDGRKCFLNGTEAEVTAFSEAEIKNWGNSA